MEEKKWSEYQISSTTTEKSNYPQVLKKLNDPPVELWWRGELDSEIVDNCVAIVGSRSITRYGRQIAEKFTEQLVAEGVTIISGFMYGIDAVVHETVTRERGRTIAVLGSGINQIYPPDHDLLYTSILRENGVVLSEFKPEQKPKPWMYAKRNRIVAAMANLGVIVIEAGVKSGSLITADFAIKLQRTVYAVPGPINSHTSEGTNWLIKNKKAKLISSIDDIKGITKLIRQPADSNSSLSLSPVENKILEVIKNEGTPLAMDEIVAISGLAVPEVSKALTMMNLQGSVEEINGKYDLKK